MKTTNVAPSEPYPLDDTELRTAMRCVTHELRLIIDNLGDFEPGELDGQEIMDLIGTWNALEQHLAYREQRPQRNLIGDEIGVEYILEDEA